MCTLQVCWYVLVELDSFFHAAQYTQPAQSCGHVSTFHQLPYVHLGAAWKYERACVCTSMKNHPCFLLRTAVTSCVEVCTAELTVENIQQSEEKSQ